MTADGEHSSMRRRVIFHGRVQGVFFRATALELSRGFGVVGYVRNRMDGTVELEAQGKPAEIDGLVGAIADHFKHNITKTEKTDVAPRADEREFGIRY